MSARLNRFANVAVYECLLGDQAGMKEFFLTPATIHSSAVADSFASHKSSTQKPMTSLDILVAQGAPAPTPRYLKKDRATSEALKAN